jgi:histone acetyltransferase
MQLTFFIRSGRKIPLDEFPGPDAKRRKIEGDVSAELVSEIVATIDKPDKMLGPEVRVRTHPLLIC